MYKGEAALSMPPVKFIELRLADIRRPAETDASHCPVQRFIDVAGNIVSALRRRIARWLKSGNLDIRSIREMRSGHESRVVTSPNPVFASENVWLK